VSLSLRLKIEDLAEPIHGWIELDGTAPRPFSGWLELMARLADVVSDAAQAPGPRSRK
jgi:hypothetical protein